MGELKDRIAGATNEAVGKAKRAIGQATDRPDITAEGDARKPRAMSRPPSARPRDAWWNARSTASEPQIAMRGAPGSGGAAFCPHRD